MPKARDFALVAHLHTRPTLQVHAPTLKLRMHSALDNLLLRGCDGQIAVSEWAAQAWRNEVPELDPQVVFNGVRLPESGLNESGSSLPKPFTVGIAVRLSERKGMDEFLRVAAAIISLDPEIRFAVAGDGPQAEHYRAQATLNGLGEVIDFRGFVAEIDQFWHTVDLGIFASAVDTFGLGIVEPVAQGCPVLAFRTGTGGDEVIDHCRAVESAPLGDIDALAQMAVALKNDPDRYARIAREGYQDVAEHFSIATMERKVMEIYGALLTERGWRG